MSDITVEKKLALVQQIRSRYNQNRYDLSNREQILYGKSAPLGANSIDENINLSNTSTFRIRLILAIILFIGIILLEQNNQTIAGFSVKQLFLMLEKDYQTTIVAWMETMVH